MQENVNLRSFVVSTIVRELGMILFKSQRVLRSSSAQHSVHPTGGSLRVFEQFARLQVGSGKMALSRPPHQRVTPAVGRREEITEGSFEGKVELLQLSGTPRAT